jgi:hypothetical protein
VAILNKELLHDEVYCQERLRLTGSAPGTGFQHMLDHKPARSLSQFSLGLGITLEVMYVVSGRPDTDA